MLFEVKKIDHYTLSFWKMEDFSKEKKILKNFNLDFSNFLSQKRKQEKLTTYLQKILKVNKHSKRKIK